MEALLAKIASMSVTASYLAAVVAFLHLLLKKAPKSLLCGLWVLVGIRLICPFSVESVFSLIPRQAAVSREILYTPVPVENVIPSAPGITQGAVPVVDAGSPVPALTQQAAFSWGTVIAAVWLLGVAGMLLYGLVSSLRIRKKVSAALCMEGNVFICDYIASPFIFGIQRPRIYLPSGLDGETARYVLAHERAHLARHDHWWKLLGFLLLAVHWFNPILWMSYCLLCRDIEMACDEKVIRDLGTGVRKSYSRALLKCSVPGRILLASPLAFGEVGVKERVKNVLNYKKPAIYVIVLCILVSVIAAGCLMTDPKTETPEPSATQPAEDPKTGADEVRSQTEPVSPPEITEPTADPLDDWEKGMGPFDVELSGVQFQVPSGWRALGDNVFGEFAENPYVQMAPKGMEDSRIRVETMTKEYYDKIFLTELPENLTASDTTVRFYPATAYSHADTGLWKYLVLTVPYPRVTVCCVIENRFTAEEWETYESEVNAFLNNFRVPEIELNWDEAVACAKTHFTDHEGYSVTALRDYNQGCWNVTFRKDGEPNEVVCLGICGEFREHHQEACYTEGYHEENHHGGHHN